jgi:hypothetical protein
MAHDGGFHCAVKTFHEAIGGGMVGGCPAEVDAPYLGQTMEELGLELASLVYSYCLRTTEAGYPTGEQGT